MPRHRVDPEPIHGSTDCHGYACQTFRMGQEEGEEEEEDEEEATDEGDQEEDV